jgi:predicted nucleic acid-binding protein
MKPLVVDASVAVKWFLPEENSDKALLVRDGFIREEYWLIVPDLMISEFGNVLWKNRGVIDEAMALDIITDLLGLGIPLVPADTIIARAYELARQYNRTVYDAMYLAVAEGRDCEMITADERLFTSVSEHLPFVHSLRSWEPREAG